ncbi:MAG: RICIN domain-containing protein [Saprospiraceae bacterium]|nr:RICIN domain-containing protein [Saprospiraceae bacterium]
MEQSLYGGGLSAKLEVTAKNFINFHNADFQLDATIKNDLRPRIVQLIKNELKSVDPINFVGTVVNEALKTFEVKKMGFKTKLKGFNKASVNVHVDARLAGQKIPINVTVNLNAGSIDKIANAVAKEIAKELQKAGSVLLKGLEDIGAGIYLAGKETIQWTSGAAETSANWLSGAMGAAGEWIVGAGGTIISAFSSSRRYDCPNVPFTAPANGRIAGPLPPDINQYRIKLHHIKTVEKGHEDNSTLEIWGSIIVKTNMAMQQDANPWLYNNSCRSTTKCKYNEANTEVSHFIDFFVASNKRSTVTGEIELELYEGDPGVDDPFKTETIDFVYENRLGLPDSPGQVYEHIITLEEDHNNPQKIEVLISIERIFEPVNSPFASVRNKNVLNPFDSKKYLSFHSSGNVSLAEKNQGNNLQTWEFVNRYDGTYNIKINGGTNPDKNYLGTKNGDLTLYSKDDGSGQQRWELGKNSDGKYIITIREGTNNQKRYLVVTSGGKIALKKKPSNQIKLPQWYASYHQRVWELTSTTGQTCNDGKKNQGETSTDCGGPNCDPCPTCNDGIQNQEETGLDCGGPCATCPTCDDGIKNQNETSIDCGGPNCYACPTCDDGIMNQGETGVDCGGPCAVCPTCDDGIKNQGETKTDCGGPNCDPCPPTCSDGIKNQGETNLDCGGPNCDPCLPTVILKNTHTKRLLFSTGHPALDREGGWTNSPAIVGTDKNYYGRGYWYLIENNDGTYSIKNRETGRLLFSAGPPVEGNEGGWTNSPAIVGADIDYYHRARWILTKHGNGYYILKNKETNRFLFSPGEVAGGASEGGWNNSPPILGTDANYYNRAYWEISGPGVPSCEDGIKNQGETSVDCGGPNCDPCLTCDDGIQNQEETGVDCGGPNCDPCPTCDDGIKNQGETSVDCGGPCVPCTRQYDDSYFKIVSKASKKVFDLNRDNGNISQYNFHGGDNQLWRVINIEKTNYVKIESKATGKVVTLNTANGNISEDAFNGGDEQLWRIEGGGYATIVSKATGKVVDLNRGNGNISQYDSHGGDNQLWKIEWAVDGSMGGVNKRYTIQHKVNGRYVDAYYKKNDYTFFTRPELVGATGHWVIESLGNDSYRIKQRSFNRYMDAHEKASNGHFVMTRKKQKNNTQHWIIKKLDDDTYTIQQKSNGRYVSVQENHETDQSVLTQKVRNNNLQSWIIKRIR